MHSLWGFWSFIRRVGEQSEIKVYPDFSIVKTAALLNIGDTMRYMGEHLSPRRGEGMEFHQLREFRVGHTLRQVDWKATARLEKPISREYQEQKINMSFSCWMLVVVCERRRELELF